MLNLTKTAAQYKECKPPKAQTSGNYMSVNVSLFSLHLYSLDGVYMNNLFIYLFKFEDHLQ